MKNLSKIVSTFLFVSLLLISTTSVFAKTTNTKTKILPKNNSHLKNLKSNQKTIAEPQNQNHFSGTVTAVSSTAVTISQKKNKKDTTSQTKTFTLDSKTQIVKDLNTIILADIKVGDKINVIMEKLSKDSSRVREIRVMTANTKNLINTNKKIKNPKS